MADHLPQQHHERLGARTVNVLVEPGGGPPVILLSGCGMPSYSWDPVARLLTGHELVRLDRPGLGGTPWPDHLPTLAEETATLIALTEAHPGGVLVAHSMASFHAEATIRRRPELVAGLVLVDGSIETTPRRPVGEGAWLAAARAAEWMAKVPPLAALGPIVDRVTVTAQSRRRLLDPMDARSITTGRCGRQRHRGVRCLPPSGAGSGAGPGGHALAAGPPGRGDHGSPQRRGHLGRHSA
jgi:pimeloyl-ACP methyl ester carboxylesterase